MLFLLYTTINFTNKHLISLHLWGIVMNIEESECYKSYSCYNRTENCSSACSLDCAGKYSCKDLNVTCLHGSSCTLKCNGEYACSGSLFGHWTTECRGNYSCGRLNIDCSEGTPCRVICSGSYSCSGSY